MAKRKAAEPNDLVSSILGVIGAAIVVMLTPTTGFQFFFWFVFVLLAIRAWREFMLAAKLELEPPDDFHGPLG
jgi:hypothetical protein